MIPTFPEFAPIALEHKGEMDAVLARVQPLASEYTFTNLFAWAETSHSQVARFGDGLLIRKETDGQVSFLQPLAPDDPDGAVRACWTPRAASSEWERTFSLALTRRSRLPRVKIATISTTCIACRS